MEFIKIKNGNLFAYEKGLTVTSSKDNKWKVSKLDYNTILMGIDMDNYKELTSSQVANLYGIKFVDSAKSCIEENINLIYKSR